MAAQYSAVCIDLVLFIRSSVKRHLGRCHLLALRKSAVLKIHVQVSVWPSVFISLGFIPRNGIAAHVVTLCLTFEELPPSFPHGLTILLSTPAVCEGSTFSTSSPALVNCLPIRFSHPSGRGVLSHCGLDSHFPDD